MGVLWPKCCSKNDEFPFKNIEQHVRSSTYLYERTRKKYREQYPGKVRSPTVELTGNFFWINPVPLPFSIHSGQGIPEFFRIEVRVDLAHFILVFSATKRVVVKWGRKGFHVEAHENPFLAYFSFLFLSHLPQH